MIFAASIAIGLFTGAAFVYAARERCLRDALGGALLVALVAAIMILALLLSGCSTAPRDGWIDIPTGFGDYPETVTPLSLAGCDGR